MLGFFRWDLELCSPKQANTSNVLGALISQLYRHSCQEDKRAKIFFTMCRNESVKNLSWFSFIKPLRLVFLNYS